MLGLVSSADDVAKVGDDDSGFLPPLPPEKHEAMPVQSLRRFERAQRPATAMGLAWLASALRRWLVFGGAAAMVALTAHEMWLALDVGGLTIVEIVVLVLFTVNIAWISLPTVSGLVGMLRLLVRGRSRAAPRRLRTRTALLMPLYNEDPARAGAALEAMTTELVAAGEGASFDVFILSDSTDGDVVLAEEEVLAALRRQLGRRLAVYYRRRMRNTAHKSGNIAEFCVRWGAAYDHFIVLDADSLMDGETIVALARRMEDSPRSGLIQTVPRLHEGKTPVAQLQQFAASVYGPVLASGLAWWTQQDGNYWGHNAIVRSRAFMTSAGLPKLAGQPPFGGFILSHDFVEAALLRRAGWTVDIADDLAGSYEASPPTLIDLAVRDRRWCQGNLQHARVLGAKGLHWVSRFHLLSGMMSFLVSPLWLLFIVATLGLGIQNEFAKPEYFTHDYALFPLWPHLDPVRALRLAFITAGILLLPKLIGLLQFATSPRRLRGAGVLFPVSVVLEVALSALLAPILMLIHCGFVIGILRGSDSGWKPQRRGDDRLRWGDVVYYHRWHVFIGVALALAARFISWEMLAWLLPAVTGMVLAAPLSALTGSRTFGRWFSWLGLLRTPLESRPAEVRQRMEAALPRYRQIVEQAPDLVAVLGDSAKLHQHLAMVDYVQRQLEPPIDALEATAELKVLRARTVEDAVAGMTAQERAFVQSAPDLLLHLARLPRQERPAGRDSGDGHREAAHDAQ